MLSKTMGGKVNLYLDDESLDLWHSIPSGHRSQIVRDALKSVGFPDENREEILLIQEKNSINNVQRVFVFLRLGYCNESYNTFFPNLN